VAINGLRTRIDKTHLEDRQRRWMSDSQNSLREYNKTDVILMSASLSKNLKELKEELIEEVHEMKYAYGDVRSKNQDLLMVISELKEKLKTFEKGKGVNTKFDKSVTSGKRLCVIPLSNNIAVQAKKVSNPEDNTDSSNSVRRPKSKDTKSKNRVMKNTNVKSSSAYVRKTPSSVKIDSNKRETKNLNECQSNASVARYGLSRDSRVKKALFTTPVAAKSKNLGATSVVAKSRFSVAKTPIATNKVSSASSLSPDSKQNSGCSKHMTGNLQLLRNFVGKFIGTVRFENDHFAAITEYRDYNLEGDDLLTGSRESNLYTISISELVASSPVCLMSKATSTKSWLWHRRLSHLNFGTINQLTSKDLVHGLPKFKYDKDHLCLTCEQGKGKKTSFPSKLVPSTESKLELIHMDLCELIRVESINVEAACTMLIFSKTPEFLWAEAIATACFTQNRSLVHTRYNKTPYELIRGRNPNVQYFHVFGSLCYLTNDRDGLGKMKSKADLVSLLDILSHQEDFISTSTEPKR
ncbi:retrovirus-related pol polyprotein from transposon TNT 1-94, partial [Tanacetum coccineum]